MSTDRPEPLPLEHRWNLPGAIGVVSGLDLATGHVLTSRLASSGATAGCAIVSSGLAVSREGGLRKARDSGGYGQPQSGWLGGCAGAGRLATGAAIASEVAAWRAWADCPAASISIQAVARLSGGTTSRRSVISRSSSALQQRAVALVACHRPRLSRTHILSGKSVSVSADPRGSRPSHAPAQELRRDGLRPTAGRAPELGWSQQGCTCARSAAVSALSVLHVQVVVQDVGAPVPLELDLPHWAGVLAIPAVSLGVQGDLLDLRLEDLIALPPVIHKRNHLDRYVKSSSPEVVLLFLDCRALAGGDIGLDSLRVFLHAACQILECALEVVA